jgi:adenylosuccinate synthase
MEGVSERGVTRLAQILEDDRLKDLLTAIAKSEDVVLKKLFGEEAEDAAKVAGALAEILDSLRNGTVLSVPEMTESLERSVT